MKEKENKKLLQTLKELADEPRQQSPMEAMEGLACVCDSVECTDYTRIRDGNRIKNPSCI